MINPIFSHSYCIDAILAILNQIGVHHHNAHGESVRTDWKNSAHGFGFRGNVLHIKVYFSTMWAQRGICPVDWLVISLCTYDYQC